MRIRILLRRMMFLCFCITIVGSSCNIGNKKVKIALMLSNMRAARWQKDKEYFLKETQKLGIEAVVLDADFNEALQFTQAEELINSGYKALVLGAVNSTTGAEIVRLAHENGVKTISYDGLIENCDIDYMISFEDKKIGALMAEYAVSKAKTGNYVIICGDKKNKNSVDIRNGEEQVLAPYIKDGRIKVTYSDFAESWSPVEASVIMKRYLQLTSGDIPVAVLVASDAMADAVIKVFDDNNLPVPIITGQDASVRGCINLVNDKQAMSVYKPIQKLAAMAATLAYKAANGETIDEVNSSVFNGLKEVPVVHVDILSVDKNNMESTVFADGFQKKEDILK